MVVEKICECGGDSFGGVGEYICKKSWNDLPKMMISNFEISFFFKHEKKIGVTVAISLFGFLFVVGR